MGWYGFDPYVPVAEKKKKALKQLEKLRKKEGNISPVVIGGKKIANTWWGVAWCKNLESYADYKNRISRGSAYVKNGFVLDLKVEEGVIKSKVYGSSLYNIIIKIDRFNDRIKDEIIGEIGRKIDSVEDLIAGNFPKEFGDIFLTQKKGLFPSPREIHFDCDCPDWADMCKHVAAALYGAGARFDENPLLFFKLRGIDANEFIKKSINDKMQNLLKNAGRKTTRVIEDADISGLFGV